MEIARKDATILQDRYDANGLFIRRSNSIWVTHDNTTLESGSGVMNFSAYGGITIEFIIKGPYDVGTILYKQNEFKISFDKNSLVCQFTADLNIGSKVDLNYVDSIKFIAVTFDNTYIKVYENGTLFDTSDEMNGALESFAEDIEIGNVNSGTQKDFILYYVRISLGVRSAEELAECNPICKYIHGYYCGNFFFSFYC